LCQPREMRKAGLDITFQADAFQFPLEFDAVSSVLDVDHLMTQKSE